ncbi:MAG: glycosyltransferase [Clostridia bacterium]|nr:glycosyltransferase [Clostridia bacterium]MDD7482586.1 glycosyltransferase [Clostridia bacterium]MDY5558343.1 glycosyltransferase [Candidatus Heritagella sp.]
MRIAFVSAGQSVHTVKWVNALAKRGHQVNLICLPNHKPDKDALHPDVKVTLLPDGGQRGYISNAGALRRAVVEFDAEIVNVHYASGYGTLMRRSKVHPTILSVWGSDVYDSPEVSPLFKKMVAKNLNAADAVASTSRIMAQRVHDFFEYDKEITVTPFGVDTTLFQPAKEKHEGFVVGCVKALEEKYGLPYLIRGFGLFLRSLPEEEQKQVSLRIYGKGSQEKALGSLIQQQGLTGSAQLCGEIAQEKVPAALQQMDVCVLPSINNSESFGVAAVEAMSCGLPVIAGDVDGFRETVEDGKTGWLIPVENDQAVCEALQRVYAMSPVDREQMGLLGRARVRRLYDMQENVDTMLALYQEISRKYYKPRKKKKPFAEKLADFLGGPKEENTTPKKK